jgi:hypothetical protein
MKLKDLYIRLVPPEIRRLRHIIGEGLLLRYLAKRWKYLGKVEKPENFPCYLAIAAIVKNEAPYIVEWIEYHLLQGVEKILVYDNESDDNLKEVIAPYIDEGIVEYIFWPNKGLKSPDNLRKKNYKLWSHWFVNKVQVPAYHNAIKHLENKTYWIAFIDIDEFIVPVSKNTVHGTLVNFESQVGVALNWLAYGHSGHIEKTNDLIIERFKSRSDQNMEFNRHTKLIINPRYILRMEDVHHAQSIDGRGIVNTRGEEIKTYCMNYPARHDKMRINHYWTKSFDENLARRGGGGGYSISSAAIN